MSADATDDRTGHRAVRAAGLRGARLSDHAAARQRAAAAPQRAEPTRQRAKFDNIGGPEGRGAGDHGRRAHRQRRRASASNPARLQGGREPGDRPQVTSRFRMTAMRRSRPPGCSAPSTSGSTAGGSDTFLHAGSRDPADPVGAGAGEPDQQVLRQPGEQEGFRRWQQCQIERHGHRARRSQRRPCSGARADATAARTGGSRMTHGADAQARLRRWSIRLSADTLPRS